MYTHIYMYMYVHVNPISNYVHVLYMYMYNVTGRTHKNVRHLQEGGGGGGGGGVGGGIVWDATCRVDQSCNYPTFLTRARECTCTM